MELIQQTITIFAAKIRKNEITGLPIVEADEATLGDILSTVYMWAGTIAVLVIVIGGLLYVLSNGDANNIQRAKNTILYAVIGLIVVIFAFTITQAVLYFTR